MSSKPKHASNLDDLVMDRFTDVYHPILTKKNPYQLRNAAFGRFRDIKPKIRSWECGLAQFIVPELYPFPEFVEYCAKHYDAENHCIMNVDLSALAFNISAVSISQMLG